jgi:hypothetical protein
MTQKGNNILNKNDEGKLHKHNDLDILVYVGFELLIAVTKKTILFNIKTCW